MTGSMTEQPWYTVLPDAELQWSGEFPNHPEIGVLWFISPEKRGWHAGQPCAVHVSRHVGPQGDCINQTNIWKITENADGTVTVQPSIHFIGHFHSPNPVKFKLVEKIPK